MMYQLVFKGECVPGVDEATARENAKSLFKASDAQVQKMFSGGRVVIRNKLDGPTAQKYQGVLKQKGIICHIEPMPGEQEPSPTPAETPSSASEKPATESAETQSAATQESVEVEPGERLPVAGEKVDSILSGSALSLGKPGEQLGEVREHEAPVFEHIDSWTIAPPGEQLVESQETPPPVMPDISHLSLADDEDDQGSNSNPFGT